MTAFKYVHVFGMILGVLLLVRNGHSSTRIKRATPVVTEIYALDHLIEIIEKIEQNVTGIYQVADQIRSLAYNDGYWEKVIGPTKPLADGILTSTEKSVLTKMVSHTYVGSLEQGVVRTSTGETIAIGSLMNGIMAGIYRKKKLTLESWAAGATKEIDNLYAATLSRVLAETALAKKNTPANELFGPGGTWDSNECPASYTKNSSSTSKASYAQLLGAVDGFILGYGILGWARDSRLGQIFRMYYTTGICFDKSFASCKRIEKLKALTNKEDLASQLSGVAEALYLKNTASYPNVKKDDILSISKDAGEKFFPKIESINTGHSCPTTLPGCELPANLVFLMDESGSIKRDHFKKEKEFVSKIIEKFNISPQQTKVGLIEFGDTAAIDFNLDLYGSKTRLKCAIQRTIQRHGKTNTAGALDLARTQIFLPIQKLNEAKSSSIQSSRSNIVILLTDGKSNVPNSNEIFAAAKRMKDEVKDLTMIAIGVGNYERRELEAVATNSTSNTKHVITSDNFNDLLSLVETLQNQTCSTPIKVAFQFNNLGKGVTQIRAFVLPGQRRLVTLPSSQFFGSSIFLDITPQHGQIRLFWSRTISEPGRGAADGSIDPIPDGQTQKIAIRNPCSGAETVQECKPLYLGIYHAETKCTCKEKNCFLPGQIMFTLAKGDPNSASNNPTATVFFVLIATVFALLHIVVY